MIAAHGLEHALFVVICKSGIETDLSCRRLGGRDIAADPCPDGHQRGAADTSRDLVLCFLADQKRLAGLKKGAREMKTPDGWGIFILQTLFVRCKQRCDQIKLLAGKLTTFNF